MKKWLLVCGILILLFSGCCKAPVVDIQAEAGAIRALEEEWSVAAQTKDLEKILGFFTSDAVSMPPGKPVLTGKDALRQRMEKLLADSTYLFETYAVTVDAVEVSSSGDWAFARGTDVISKKTAAGIAEEKGKWLDVWKKVNGEWKCAVGIGNDGY